MPAGLGAFGIVYFGAAKFLGYSAAAAYINREIPESPHSPWLVGGVRTVIGVVAGAATVYEAFSLGILRSGAGFFALLAPVRICEWFFLLLIFYSSPTWIWKRSLKLALLGTAWSYVLDVPAILSVFVIPGGMWIC